MWRLPTFVEMGSFLTVLLHYNLSVGDVDTLVCLAYLTSGEVVDLRFPFSVPSMSQMPVAGGRKRCGMLWSFENKSLNLRTEIMKRNRQSDIN